MGLLRRMPNSPGGPAVSAPLPSAEPMTPAAPAAEPTMPSRSLPPLGGDGGSSPPPPTTGRLGGAVAAAAPPGQRGAGLGAAPGSARTAAISRDLKGRVKNRLIAELDPDMDLSKTTEVRQRIKALFDAVV